MKIKMVETRHGVSLQKIIIFCEQSQTKFTTFLGKGKKDCFFINIA